MKIQREGGAETEESGDKMKRKGITKHSSKGLVFSSKYFLPCLIHLFHVMVGQTSSCFIFILQLMYFLSSWLCVFLFVNSFSAAMNL